MSRKRPKRGVLPPAQEVCHTDEECVLYCRYVSAQWHTEALDILNSFRFMHPIGTWAGNLRDANQLMDELKKQVEEKQLDLPQLDLIQFSTFLLQTLQRDALPLFNILKVKYQSSIDRKPSFKELLDEIAGKFYGVRRRNPLQGMFGDIFKMMGAEWPLKSNFEMFLS